MDRSVRHGPNRLQRYLQIHETVLGHRIYTGAVEEDELSFTPGANGHFYFDGGLWLRERHLYLYVTKDLEITNGSDVANPEIQTVLYSYNVSIVGFGNVFRYCSPHGEDGPAHHRQHHRHQYDPFSAAPARSTETLIANGDWPVLSEVIDEADQWYWDNQSNLMALGVLET